MWLYLPVALVRLVGAPPMWQTLLASTVGVVAFAWVYRVVSGLVHRADGGGGIGSGPAGA